MEEFLLYETLRVLISWFSILSNIRDVHCVTTHLLLFIWAADLEELYMGYFNNYSSAIPATFGNLSSLVRLDMGRCGLIGPIPPELGNLGNLDTLFLQLNQLTGVIPSQVGNLVNLVSLDLSYNNLSGVIPTALIYLQKLRLLSLMSNDFVGTIPDFLGELPNLEVRATLITLWP